MKKYWYYIAAGHVIDDNAQFYKVAVPGTRQGQRDYQKLKNVANSLGHFFSIVDYDSTEFVHKIAESLYPSCDYTPLDFLNFKLIDARQLVKLLCSSLDCSGGSNNAKARHQFRWCLSLSYRSLIGCQRD